MGLSWVERFGVERAKEMKEKLIERNKRGQSEESRRKISKAQKGKLHTEEEKRKISESLKRKWQEDSEFRKRQNESMKKAEVRKRISDSVKIKWQDAEYAKRVSAKSPEARRKMSECMKLNNPMKNPEVVRKISGRAMKPEVRKKISEAQKHPEVRKKKSETTRKLWQSLEFRNKVIPRILSSSHRRPNQSEHLVSNLLDAVSPNKFIYCGCGDVVIGGKCPDFISVDDSKKIIEFFGDYWHNGDDGISRIEHFKKFGYLTLIIRESELSDLSKLLKILGEFVL